ncbi:MAG: glycosyltransferase family 4 protein [candidate division WOR-3 bacterium]
MKILYVSQYFPPEMGAPSARVYELSKHWVRMGHKVTVLTGYPNHPTGIVPQDYKTLLKYGTIVEKKDGIDVIRTWLYPAPNRLPYERILNYSSFFISACLRGLMLSKFDIIVGTSPQLLCALAGWIISRNMRRPFIFEVRDIWPESLLASGIGRENSQLIRTLKKIAVFLYNRSETIVVVTEAFKSELVRKYNVPESKIEIIENGIETDRFYPMQDVQLIRKKFGFDNKFVVSYIGTIGYAHGLDIVIRAAKILKDKIPDLYFVLLGEGVQKERLKAEVYSEKLDNVFILDQVLRDKIPAFINASDVCLVSLRKSELFKTVIPSKMLEFMACGKPLILAVDGQARRIMESAEAGIYIEPENHDELINAVVKMYNEPYLRRKYGENGRNYILKYFTRQQKANQYLTIITKMFQSFKH